ncbi:MAG: ABC transporter permease [Oscillospiraceae bacterium]|nr:ABC transporter permease [Oscillospiraceae bacterium]
MWLKKLRHKKLQFTLVGIVLFVSALIFSASLCFTMEAGRLGEEYYNRDGMPNLFYSSSDKDLPDAIQKALPAAYLGTAEGVQLSEPIEYAGKKATGIIMVFPLEDCKDVLWEVVPKEGDTDQPGPRPGEVWITKVWADLKGMKTGDTIIVQGDLPLRVGALVNTYINPSTDVSLVLFFVNPDDMGALAELPPAFIVPLCVAGDLDGAKALISPLTEGYNKVMAIDRDTLISSLSASSMVMGGVGILSAMLIFVVSVFVIRFMLRANLMKEYRSIGIYKSQGFSNRSIRGFYYKCYALVGGMSITIGALAGLPAANALSGLTARYMTGYSDSPSYASGLFISLALLFLVLILNVYTATRPIKKITPVAALRIGVTSSKAKFKRSIIRNAYSPLSMAVNDIGKHKGYSVMIVSILCVSLYLAVFSLSMKTTIDHVSENVDAWFSLPKADFYVTGRIDDSLIEDLESCPPVGKVIVSEDWFSTSVKFDEMYKHSDAVSAWCFSDFSDLPYTRGRAPSAENEIAMTNLLLGDLGLGVGDYISLTLGNTKGTFLITGAYNAMINNGQSVQLWSGSLPAHGVEFVPAVLSVKLNGGEPPEGLIFRINQEYQGVQAAKDLDMVIDAARGVQEMASPIMIVMIMTFILFSVLCITNLILQNHADNRRQYGIMKSLGFTTAYIAARSAWRIFLLSIVAAALGMALHLTISRGLFAGVVIDAMLLAIPQVLFLLLCLLILIMALTLVFCLPIRKITPQELIEE